MGRSARGGSDQCDLDRYHPKLRVETGVLRHDPDAVESDFLTHSRDQQIEREVTVRYVDQEQAGRRQGGRVVLERLARRKVNRNGVASERIEDRHVETRQPARPDPVGRTR